MLKSVTKTYLPILIAVSFIVALIIPLPSLIIDLTLVLIVGLSLMIYVRATNINAWHDFKTLPSLILLISIFRVSINISTTRKILTDGEAGHVIEQFGSFVVNGNMLVGVVIFLVLIIFQVVIANGSSRSAEVAARFTLDAMPGKQMAIDADLQQRMINESEARERRKLVTMEADFYGAMDGAGKFVKGDVFFGIAVVIVNVVFGLVVGVAQQGMSFGEAAVRYTQLSIGDGIISQLGSLMIAMASGVIIARVYDESGKDLPRSIYGELMKNGAVTYTLGGLFVAMGIFTKLPFLPFVSIGLVVIYLGYKHQKSLAQEKEDELQKEIEMMHKNEDKKEEEVGDNFGIMKNNNPILVELGIDLVPLISQKINGQTAKDRVNLMRKMIAHQLGITVPAISFKDNTSLKPKGKYVIKIKGTKVAEGVLKTGHLLALKTPLVVTDLEAEPAKDPIFNEDGFWIEESMVAEATMENYQILEPLGMLVTHLDMSIRKHLHELIQRQQVKDLVDTLEQDNSVLLEEIKTKQVELSMIQGVLQQLLKEGISVQDLPTIIEGIIDGKGIYKNVDEVTSLVREKISKYICDKAKSKDGKIHVLLLEENIEVETKTYMDGHKGLFLNWEVQFESELMQKIAREIRKARVSEVNPVILTRRKDVRIGLVKILNKFNIEIPVLCLDELVSDVNVEQIAVVG